MDELDLMLSIAKNGLGPLTEPLRFRLRAVVECPCEEHWDEAQGILLSWSPMVTLWQAVIAVDPSFPRTGKVTDAVGELVLDWQRVPDSDLLLRAICYGVTLEQRGD